MRDLFGIIELIMMLIKKAIRFIFHENYKFNLGNSSLASVCIVTSLNALNQAFINKISNTAIDYRNINIENIEALIQYDTVMSSLGAFHGLGVINANFITIL